VLKTSTVLFRRIMYKPPENHISDIEDLILQELAPEALQKVNDDVVWMLQTDSYRYYYLDRLEQIEQSVSKLIKE
jgi:hypothetical protein